MKDYVNYGKPLVRQNTRQIPWVSIICFTLTILILTQTGVEIVF